MHVLAACHLIYIIYKSSGRLPKQLNILCSIVLHYIAIHVVVNTVLSLSSRVPNYSITADLVIIQETNVKLQSRNPWNASFSVLLTERNNSICSHKTRSLGSKHTQKCICGRGSFLEPAEGSRNSFRAIAIFQVVDSQRRERKRKSEGKARKEREERKHPGNQILVTALS